MARIFSSVRAVALVDAETGEPITQVGADVFGSLDDEPYADPTGVADGTVIALLKAIYINTIPA